MSERDEKGRILSLTLPPTLNPDPKQALSEKDEKGRVLSVQETRLTHFFIHVLFLVSIFAMQADPNPNSNPNHNSNPNPRPSPGPNPNPNPNPNQAVKQIPVPVLYGVFLYMGIGSLSGNQVEP